MRTDRNPAFETSLRSDQAVDAVLKGEKHDAERVKAAHDAARQAQGKEIARPRRAAARKP